VAKRSHEILTIGFRGGVDLTAHELRLTAHEIRLITDELRLTAGLGSRTRQNVIGSWYDFKVRSSNEIFPNHRPDGRQHIAQFLFAIDGGDLAP